MEAVMQHVQERWQAYAVAAACILPLVVIFRRQVLPVLWYAFEICFYIATFHVVWFGMVRLARWFKFESSTYVTEKEDPGWTTSLLEFWDRSQYKPAWLFYFEVVVVVLILYGVWRFRPFKIQKLKPRSASPRKGMASGVRPMPSTAKYGAKR